jgi:hypothetical protein
MIAVVEKAMMVNHTSVKLGTLHAYGRMSEVVLKLLTVVLRQTLLVIILRFDKCILEA